MLQALPEAGRDLVLGAAQRRTYARGEVLVRQGDEASSLYVIESGRVAVRLIASSGDTLTLGVMGVGEVFGEVGVALPRHERTSSVVALDAVTTLVLRREVLDRLRARHPEVGEFLLRVLAERTDRLSRRLLEAHHVPVDRRVARRLLEVGRLFAEDRPPVVLPLTQEDVAHLAGTTRPTANQVLQRLQADGAVRLVRGRVELLDVRELRAHCR
jgi:CRP-like cAMP-binding protein